MRRFLIALQFLTIFPIKISAEGVFAFGEKSGIKESDFGGALSYFPVVGLLISAALILILTAFNFLPYPVKIILVLIGSIIITGAMHLDGFADTCDGFSVGKSKEKILEVMRDPHIGTAGVAAVVSIMLLKFTLMAGIPNELLWKSLVMMVVFGRWSQVLACYGSRYARENGKAKSFVEYATLKELAISGVITILVFLLLGKWKGFFLFLSVSIAAYLFIHCLKKKIAGVTGDTIGAVNEISEICVLLFFLISSRVFLW